MKSPRTSISFVRKNHYFFGQLYVYVLVFLSTLAAHNLQAGVTNPISPMYLNAIYGITVGNGYQATNILGTLRYTNNVLQMYNGTSWVNQGNSGTNSDHATLDNLDYNGSGHLGFAGTGVVNRFTEDQHVELGNTLYADGELRANGHATLANGLTVGGSVVLSGTTVIGSSSNASSYIAYQARSNITVSLDSTMSASDINTLIDNVPKNMGRSNLIFDFAAGTYDIDDAIVIDGFFNFNQLTIRGVDTTSNAPCTNQTSIISVSTNSGVSPMCNVLYLRNNRASIDNPIIIQDLAMSNKLTGITADGANGTECVFLMGNSRLNLNNCFLRSDCSSGILVYAEGGDFVQTQANTFMASATAVSSVGGRVTSISNAWGGVQPTVGLAASYGGIIASRWTPDTTLGVTPTNTAGCGIYVGASGLVND